MTAHIPTNTLTRHLSAPPPTVATVSPFLRAPKAIINKCLSYLPRGDIASVTRVSRECRTVNIIEVLGLDGELNLGLHSKYHNRKERAASTPSLAERIRPLALKACSVTIPNHEMGTLNTDSLLGLFREVNFPSARTLTFQDAETDQELIERNGVLISLSSPAKTMAVLEKIPEVCPELLNLHISNFRDNAHLDAFLDCAIILNILECLRIDHCCESLFSEATISKLNDPAFSSLREIHLNIPGLSPRFFNTLSQLKKLTTLKYKETCGIDIYWKPVLILKDCVNLRELTMGDLPVTSEAGRLRPSHFLNDLRELLTRLPCLKSLRIQQSLINPSDVYPALHLAKRLTHLRFDDITTCNTSNQDSFPICQEDLKCLELCMTLEELIFQENFSPASFDDLLEKLLHLTKPPKLRELTIFINSDTVIFSSKLERLRNAWLGVTIALHFVQKVKKS